MSNSGVKRIFLGWDKPVVTAISDYLIPVGQTDPLDLGENIIVVPTRKAGRNLRRAMAERVPLLDPRIEVPRFFLQPHTEFANIATHTEMLAAWIHVLQNEKLGDYPNLFPTLPPEINTSWILSTAQIIQQLRQTLVEGGLRLDEVNPRCPELSEADRWNDLASLEKAYIERMLKIDRYDEYIHLIKQARNPSLPENCKKIIIAATPDPSPAVQRALISLAKFIEIEILIHAPESMADHFNEWGIPLSTQWKDYDLNFHSMETELRLCKTPTTQAEALLECMAQQESQSAEDFAIGVPDSNITPAITTQFKKVGINAYDPANIALTTLPVYRILQALLRWANQPLYRNAEDCFRLPDLLSYLEREHQIDPQVLLIESDDFQNKFLPQLDFKISETRFPNLKTAHEALQSLTVKLKSDPLTGTRDLLSTLYAGQAIDPTSPQGDAFLEAAQAITATLEECSSEKLKLFNKLPVMELMLHQLKSVSVHSGGEVSHIDLQGWLELHWSTAPHLIITGMNEGAVPESRHGDPFLPDSTRKQLGMRTDADRYARDTYLLAALQASRMANGSLHLLCGKFTSEGDPLRPSRLLFQCNQDEQRRLAEALFSEPKDQHSAAPFSHDFQLNPNALESQALEKISVTKLSGYLTCPFRFYLSAILGMEEQDNSKVEMDAMDFGNAVHKALEILKQPEFAKCSDADMLSSALQDEVKMLVQRTYGRHLPVHLQIQLSNACQRLHAAAGVQAESAAEGWEVIETETYLEKAEVAGFPIRGIIDRVDFHPQHGYRILDYKTFESMKSLKEKVFGTPRPHHPDYAQVEISSGKRKSTKVWADLQLPLYQLLWTPPKPLPVSVGYFLLPKALSDTAIHIWEHDEALGEKAMACVEGILADIRAERFWPPSEKVQYDNFEQMIFTTAEEAFVQLEKELSK